MSVRRRTWTTATGAEKEAWIVDYVDGKGVRRQKTFSSGRQPKKQADAFEAIAKVQVREGVHVADSASVTVREAGALWVKGAEDAGLERSTTAAYRSHVELHMVPLIGSTKLSELNVPFVRAFADELRDKGRSPAMVRRILVSLGTLIADAQERGLVVRNVVRDMRGQRRRGDRQEKRHKAKLKVGVDIPTRDEVRAIVRALQGRWRPLLLTAIFTGLRASELRGLRWSDVDFDQREIHVHQRADRFNEIGRPKSASGERVVPIPPVVLNALREWKLACPVGALDLVFPNGRGNVEQLNNIIRRGLMPVQVAAGVVVDGKAKYTGMHALRHFYASWCINRREDGGLGLPSKVVQERLGHSSIVLTMDVYGHLFPRGDDADEMAAAERSLLG